MAIDELAIDPVVKKKLISGVCRDCGKEYEQGEQFSYCLAHLHRGYLYCNVQILAFSYYKPIIEEITFTPREYLCKHTCSCDMVSLLKQGCTCGGI